MTLRESATRRYRQSPAALLAQVLPDTEAEVQEKLDELYMEIEPLAKQKNKIDSRASRCRIYFCKHCVPMPGPMLSSHKCVTCLQQVMLRPLRW